MLKHRFIITAILFLMNLAPASASEEFAITVFRQFSDKSCTSGYLGVNGKIICYALERPWLGNIPLISSIPAGKYHAHLRYDHTDAWRVELDNVPGRTNIQIHVGNFVADSEGCILVGNRVDSKDLCTLIDSATAYGKLKSAFYGTETPTSTPDKEISVEIKDGG